MYRSTTSVTCKDPDYASGSFEVSCGQIAQTAIDSTLTDESGSVMLRCYSTVVVTTDYTGVLRVEFECQNRP